MNRQSVSNHQKKNKFRFIRKESNELYIKTSRDRSQFPAQPSRNLNFDVENRNQNRDRRNINHSKSKLSKNRPIGNFKYLKLESINTIKLHRRIISRQKRKKLIREYGILKLFWNCTSKVQLMQIFEQMTLVWKKFLQFYLSRCLIFHLTIRQLKNVSELMRHRQNLYDCVNEPELLVSKINFSNNLIKNFCKGLSNFFIMFYDELVANKMIPSLKSLKTKKNF
jgi:hypothetical protein